MQKITYRIVGVVTIILSLGILFYMLKDIVGSIINYGHWFVLIDDGAWFILLASFLSLILGILYLFFGNKFLINKLSDWSVKLIISAIVIGFGGVGLVYLFLFLTNSDPMGLILSVIPVLIGFLLAIISFILLIISIFKKN